MCVRVYVCACVLCVGGVVVVGVGGPTGVCACVSAFTRTRGCVLTIHHRVLRTQKY